MILIPWSVARYFGMEVAYAVRRITCWSYNVQPHVHTCFNRYVGAWVWRFLVQLFGRLCFVWFLAIPAILDSGSGVEQYAVLIEIYEYVMFALVNAASQ